MPIRVLDLDGSLLRQNTLLAKHWPAIIPTRHWGSGIRLACSFRRFRRFESEMASLLGADKDHTPAITLYGSGDFHHVSLALLHRLAAPCNLLILDNHPDWMRGVPFLHCGTWVYHAARLPMIRRVFHVGGDVDFDNYYRPLAPWPALQSGAIRVFPGIRRFERGQWRHVRNEPLRLPREARCRQQRLEQMLRPFAAELAVRPLYVSLDKDVLAAEHAIVNWDSGHLDLPEVKLVLTTFLELANGQLAGMDIVGDWSPVHLRGWLRRFFHLTEHPGLHVDPDQADDINQQTNLDLLSTILEAVANKSQPTLLYG
jgi:hypothetical protein